MKNRLLLGYLYKKKSVAVGLLMLDALSNLFFAFRPKRALPQIVSKILIVKPDHLGDCLLSSGALKSLSEQYPEASFDYLAGPWGAPVLREYSRIRKIWIIRHAQHNRSEKGFTKWRIFWRDLIETIPKIRRENYDLLVVLRAFGGNFVFTSLLMNGKFTVGHGTGGGAALLDRKADWIADKHEVEHFTEVLQLIRSDLHSAAPYFSASSDGLPGLPDTYTCVHPGAGAQSKKLSPETWSQVLRGSADPLVICGTPQDSEWARSLELDVDRPVIDLTSGLSIADFYRVVSNAKVTHVLDSFSAHLAAASNCPRVIAHFLPSSDPVQWRPLGPNVEVVLHANP